MNQETKDAWTLMEGMTDEELEAYNTRMWNAYKDSQALIEYRRRKK